MQHRHLTADAGWSKAAIDSILERGDLPDWQELFAALGQDNNLAATVIEVAQQHRTSGSGLAIYLAEQRLGSARLD
jgi:hypothetical protein